MIALQAAEQLRLWKANTTSELVRLSSVARLAQLKYMNAKDQGFVDENLAAMKQFYELTTKLKDSFNQQENKVQADSVYAAAKSYQNSFDAWVAAQTELEETKKSLVAAGDRASAECDALRTSQKTQMDEELASNADSKTLRERLGKADDANRMIKYILQSAVARRDFMINPTDENRDDVLRINQELIAQCEETKSKMSQAANREQIDAVLVATKEYVAEFNNYCDLRERQNEEAVGMVASANALVAECAAIRTDQEQKLARANQNARTAITERIAKADDANRLIKWAMDCRIQEKNFIIRGDKKYQTENDETMKSVYGLCDDLTARFQDPKNREQVASILVAAEKYKESFDNSIEIHDAQQKEEQAMIAAAQDFGKGADGLRQGQKRKMTEASSSATTLMIGLAAGSMLLGVILAWVITGAITKPFKSIFKGLKTFSKTELAETSSTFNRIIDGMTEGVTQVNDAAGQVSTASQQLAEGASEQASSLEETSSALEQMAAMTRTNAENAKQANELATQAHTAAENGDATMTAISESSAQISKIIKVIEEIAFQTNLLALNAAVEAARAGEHGKGFAVVADEVRNLAQRAAQAARETTGLIEDSVTKSQEGTTAVQDIVTGVTKVAELLSGISQASEEQAQGVEQVNTAVSQMDKVTQQNASGAEESAAAAEELSSQAASTRALVDELVVMVKGADQRATARPTRSRTPQTHPNTRVAHPSSPIPETHTITAAKGGDPSDTSEFMQLDDAKNMKDF